MFAFGSLSVEFLIEIVLYYSTDKLNYSYQTEFGRSNGVVVLGIIVCGSDGSDGQHLGSVVHFVPATLPLGLLPQRADHLREKQETIQVQMQIQTS